jgi:hypothetical protein
MICSLVRRGAREKRKEGYGNGERRPDDSERWWRDI